MASKAIAAVVFDLDGVLIDSEREWDAARRALVAEFGGRWTEDATHAMLGMSAPEWSRYLREVLHVPLEPDEINARVVARVLVRYGRHLPLLPGALAAARRLAESWPLGLATSSNRPVIDAVLEAAGISDLFAATVSSEEVGRGKPAPDVYLEAARRLGVKAEDAAAIEDSSNGLRAAAAAAMVVVAVPNRDFPPAEDALALADLVLESLDELTAASIRDAMDRRASGA